MKDSVREWVFSALSSLQTECGLPAPDTVSIEVTRCKSPEHGDMATNVAMMLAKTAKMSPRLLAEKLVASTSKPPHFAEVSVAGPGFINIRFCPIFVAQAIHRMVLDDRLGVATVPHPETIVVDYSSPNLAKEMHVGHLRTTIIGDALVRVLSWLGHRVVRQNHVGDWGTQFGMLLAFMAEKNWTDVEVLSRQLSDLELFYQQAKQAFDASASFADRARHMVVKLQQGDPECRRLWQVFSDVSMQHCHAIYEALNVLLQPQDVKGESTYEAMLPEVVSALDAQGLLQLSGGAKVVFSKTLTNKDDQPLPLLVEKQGGGYLYATTDLAAVQYRTETLRADRILYVVDQRQALHFQQIFEVVSRMPWPKVSMCHVGFGTVNGPDGKPFKTRDGGTTKLMDLIVQAKQQALLCVAEKNPDMAQEDQQAIADAMAISAIKYADLSKVRTGDYIFDLQAMLSFEGNTAPYLLYAYARLHQLLQKASAFEDTPPTFTHPAEMILAHHLLAFPERVAQVAQHYLPHVLCQYLYDLSSHLMRFYEQCPILKAAQPAQNSRLVLCALTAKVLSQGLSLLGIDVLERM